MTDRKVLWTEWLDLHGRTLVAYAKQWVHSHSDAEDIVQDAFLRFWRSQKTVRDPLAYLYVCVRRSAMDWFRSKRHRAILGASTNVAKDLDNSIFAENKPEQHELQAVIDAALEQLPLEQREVLIMKIWGGLTFRQISEAVKISPNTTASRYRYALKNLRRHLDRESVE